MNRTSIESRHLGLSELVRIINKSRVNSNSFFLNTSHVSWGFQIGKRCFIIEKIPHKHTKVPKEILFR